MFLSFNNWFYYIIVHLYAGFSSQESPSVSRMR